MTDVDWIVRKALSDAIPGLLIKADRHVEKLNALAHGHAARPTKQSPGPHISLRWTVNRARTQPARSPFVGR